MKLTKLQRYTAYCIMLAEAEHKIESFWGGTCSDGFCRLIWKLFAIDFYNFPIKHFKELEEKSPDNDKKYQKTSNGLWFNTTNSGWKKRIEILKQCIEETHPDNPKNKRK